MLPKFVDTKEIIMSVMRVVPSSYFHCLHNCIIPRHSVKGCIHRLKQDTPFFLPIRRKLSTKTVLRPPAPPRRIASSSYGMLIIPVATFLLGTWQVRRRRWKLDLIAYMESKTEAPPIEFPEDVSELEDLEYRKVQLYGTFDHSREVYIGPRSLITKGESQSGGLFSGGGKGPGMFVVTPFHLSDKDLTILVNRGWVPKKQLDPKLRLKGQVQGEVAIMGVVRNAEKRAPFTPKNQQQYNNIWLYRDIMSIARTCDTAPIFVDADEQSTVPGGPVGGQTIVSLRNDHLSYIITWYSLCAATTYMWYQRYIRRLPVKL